MSNNISICTHGNYDVSLTPKGFFIIEKVYTENRFRSLHGIKEFIDTKLFNGGTQIFIHPLYSSRSWKTKKMYTMHDLKRRPHNNNEKYLDPKVLDENPKMFIKIESLKDQYDKTRKKHAEELHKLDVEYKSIVDSFSKYVV